MKPERRRLTTSFGISLLLHGLIFALIALQMAQSSAPVLSLSIAPITVALSPTPPPEARSMVDAVAPTAEPVGPTDLIAEQNSKAQDLSDVVGKRLAPFFENPSEFDQVAGPPSAEPVQTPAPQAPAKPTAPPEKHEKPRRELISSSKKANDRTQLAMADAREQLDMAAGEAARGADAAAENGSASEGNASPGSGQSKGPSGPGTSPGESRGRVDGGVLTDGFTGFEALKSDIAPYLKEIRARVEHKWFAAMAFRYKGVSPTTAVVDCAINREGKLVYATIHEEGSVALFARVCKESIQEAAPFPPFSFEVPDIYANKDLEIRWTFSFMN
jgi:hypothetical protein